MPSLASPVWYPWASALKPWAHPQVAARNWALDGKNSKQILPEEELSQKDQLSWPTCQAPNPEAALKWSQIMCGTAAPCHLLIFKWIIISTKNCLESKIIFFCIWNDSRHVFPILSGTVYLYKICMLVCIVICVFEPVYIISNHLRRHTKVFQRRTKLLKSPYSLTFQSL